MNLSNTQRQFLRRAAHSLRPLAQIGKNGLTNEVVGAVDEALAAHELIKVKFGDFREEKRELSEQLAADTNSVLVALIGNIAILYRPNPDRGVVVLPA